MTPYYRDEWLTIYQGDVRAVLPELSADSVDCIVTSPPYWGLRDYGSDGQLGLERTPEEYVANLVAVFRELRRVLKPSGTCWLNLGDSYNSSSGQYGHRQGEFLNPGGREPVKGQARNRNGSYVNGLKPKDLVGIPWRVAFALQADGWYLRSDIIWAKPNPMPESVTDRPTKAHEYLFLLTKSARYFFDADAVREAYSEKTVWTYAQPDKAAKVGLTNNGTGKSTLRARPGTYEAEATPDNPHSGRRGPKDNFGLPEGGRNLRSVWTIATRPYPGAHFAVFPPELPERCIKAGSPLNGVVLDPFAGSGTTGMVANRLSRRAILIDLNGDYLKQQLKRNAQTPLGLAG